MPTVTRKSGPHNQDTCPLALSWMFKLVIDCGGHRDFINHGCFSDDDVARELGIYWLVDAAESDEDDSPFLGVLPGRANPLGLVQRAHTTYLIATVEPFDDIRQFVVHRFEEAHLLASACSKPDGFNLKNYVESGAMQFGTHEKIQLEAWVSEGLTRLLQESPISHDMLLVTEDEGSRLTATVNDSWELKWWILSHAGSIQVHQPQGLRDEIHQRLRTALELHE